MLKEESEMEKKNPIRQAGLPTRTNGNEVKKENSTPKKFQRRKGNGASGNFSYNEGQARKALAQKFKSHADKRPRSRGGFIDRPRDDLDDSPVTECDPSFYTGSRKGNLNHLLNFSYLRSDDYATHRGVGWGHGKYGYRSGRQPRKSQIYYNKEQFLQANCQFVVRDDEDYSVNLMDPDSLVSWDVVEQVRVVAHESSSCPICLQYPVAAKMTRCGHIFCWPCILHYLALGEKSWRKCPICYDDVQSEDLRSAVSREVVTYKVGDTIKMNLMKKVKGSLYAVPSVSWTKRAPVCHNIQDSVNLTRHMKLLVATPKQVLKLLDEERGQLQQLAQDAEPSEEVFIDSALTLLKEREILVQGADNKRAASSDPDASTSEATAGAAATAATIDPDIAETVEQLKCTGLGGKLKVYKSAFSDEEEEEAGGDELEKEVKQEKDSAKSTSDVEPHGREKLESNPDSETCGGSEAPEVSQPLAVSDPSAVSQESGVAEGALSGRERPVVSPLSEIMPVEEAAEHLEMPCNLDSTRKTRNKSGEDSYYFYQASDGQHIYLHSLNARCLVKEYGSLEHCPPVIEATIVETESVFVTEELRKRLRYLSHLPLTCSFEVAELALKPPLIGKDTLKCFTDEIEKRKRLRHRKKRDEKKMAKRIDEEERKKLGLCTGTIIYSQFNDPKTAGTTRASTAPKPNTYVDETASSTSSPSLDTPIGSPIDWPGGGMDDPGRGDQATHMSFAQMLKAGKKSSTIWPKVNSDVPLSSNSQAQGGDDSEEEKDSIPAPEYQQSFGSAIETALLNMRAKDCSREDAPTSPQKGSSGKKKKKQLVLFSTSMARGGN